MAASCENPKCYNNQMTLDPFKLNVDFYVAPNVFSNFDQSPYI